MLRVFGVGRRGISRGESDESIDEVEEEESNGGIRFLISVIPSFTDRLGLMRVLIGGKEITDEEDEEDEDAVV